MSNINSSGIIIPSIVPNICTINTIPVTNKKRKITQTPKTPRPGGITIQYGHFDLNFK